MIELLLPMTLMFSNTHRSKGAFLPLTIAVGIASSTPASLPWAELNFPWVSNSASSRVWYSTLELNLLDFAAMVLKMWREKLVPFIWAFALKTIEYVIFRESLAKADWSKYVQHKCFYLCRLTTKRLFYPFSGHKIRKYFWRKFAKYKAICTVWNRFRSVEPRQLAKLDRLLTEVSIVRGT